MIRLCLWLGLVCSTLALSGQTLSPTLLGSAGAHASQAAFGSLDWSVGEAVVATLSPAPGSAPVLTQGFHQVFVSVTTDTHNDAYAGFNPLVYPNPGRDRVYVQSTEPVRARLWSLSGIELIPFDAPADFHTLPLTELPSGTYLLEVARDEQPRGKIFKLQIVE